MAQARKIKKNKVNKKNTNNSQVLQHLDQRLHEASAIFLFALTGFLLISLITYNPIDSGFVHLAKQNVITNSGGKLGAWFADAMYYFFGYIAFWIPICISYTAYKSYQNSFEVQWPPHWFSFVIKSIGFFIALFSGSALASIYWKSGSLIGFNFTLKMGAGGVFGNVVSAWFIDMFSFTGASVFLLASFFIGVTLVTGISWIAVMDFIGNYLIRLIDKIGFFINYYSKLLFTRSKDFLARPVSNINSKMLLENAHKQSKRVINRNKSVLNKDIPRATSSIDTKKSESKSLSVLETFKKPKVNIEKVKTEPKNLSKAKQMKITAVNPDGLPEVSLLELPELNQNMGYTDDELHTLSRIVEQKLLDFNIQAQVVGVQPGPVIVRFELHLAPGIKVSKVTSLAKDLARSLSIVSVRVVEVIPGKPYVGLEVPNTHREVVRLRELLEHADYHKSKSPLTLVLGKDISGKITLADLAKMPHLLVAGTTGSGKSVGVNAMLMSILFKATPKDVRLIMIDPKMLELSVYDGIPHLLCPVVTDMKDAANALKWCVAEMERRYKLMAALGVRNLASFNRKIEDAARKNEPITDPLWPEEADEPAPILETLPFIVVVVDEFADMIMVVGRKVEELIARIAQKARAAGIHMILATQRPSVDVITGLIKANVPTRIAFQVSSKIDSRTILDQQGAEQLLGQGDMLYLPPGSGLPVRVHGAFVSDQEVHAVADDWRTRQAPDYNEDIVGSNINIPGLPKLATDDFENDTEHDPLYDKAVQFILETRKASISSVQRRFKIGYNRAATIIEQMEAAGIVSAMGAKGAREILIPEGQGLD